MIKKEIIMFLLGKFRNTIGYLLFKKIFLTYIIFIISLTSYQIYAEYSSSKEQIKKEMKTTESFFYKILSESIWSLEQTRLQKNIKEIIKTRELSGVSIISPENEIIILEGTILKKYQSYKNYFFKDNHNKNIKYENDLEKHSFPLYHIEDNLGTVTFYIKSNRVYDLAKKSIFLILLNTFVSVIILWILFQYYAKKFLTRPLNQLIEATKELGAKHYNEVEISFNTEKKHELNTLTETFNKMSKQINEAFVNMQQLTIIQDKQKKDLEEANKYKNDFLANMSHELKTPLNSINVISSVMMKNKKNELNENHVKNLKIINSCGNDLLYLINDVLDISKLEAGEVDLNMDQVDFKKLIFDIKDMFEPQVKEKKLNFIFEYDEIIGNIFSDENRIKQIVKNLLSNALKFVKDGNIELLVKDDVENIKIIVKDDGIGISKDKLEHIFDRFKQADGSTTRKYGGTGLGLAICKDLLVLLNGSISVESEVNKGTIFTVIFPKNRDKVIKTTKNNNDVLLEKEENNQNNILLLNNDPLSFLSIVVELKKDFNVEQSSNLTTFLNMYKENDYTYVILDIENQKVENIEKVLNTIKSKVILISNDVPSVLEDKYLKLFLKPLNKDELINFIKGVENE